MRPARLSIGLGALALGGAALLRFARVPVLGPVAVHDLSRPAFLVLLAAALAAAAAVHAGRPGWGWLPALLGLLGGWTALSRLNPVMMGAEQRMEAVASPDLAVEAIVRGWVQPAWGFHLLLAGVVLCTAGALASLAGPTRAADRGRSGDS